MLSQESEHKKQFIFLIMSELGIIACTELPVRRNLKATVLVIVDAFADFDSVPIAADESRNPVLT